MDDTKQQTDRPGATSQPAPAPQEHELPWNLPAARIDYKYWGKMPYWSADEAVAVLLEKNPAKIKHRVITAFQDEHGEHDFCQRYIDLHRLFYRAIAEQHILVRDKPMHYLQCAKKLDIEVPEALEQVVIRYAEKFVDWESRYKTAVAELGSIHSDLESLKRELEP